MEPEAAKAAAMRAKDTQLSTLTRLLSPPALGSGERSDSDADDAEAHLEPFSVQHGGDEGPHIGAVQPPQPPQPRSAAAAGPAPQGSLPAEGAGQQGAAAEGGVKRVPEQELAHAKALLASAVLPLPAVSASLVSSRAPRRLKALSVCA
jgi:hypothetical protein